jgi:hypothetical protein
VPRTTTTEGELESNAPAMGTDDGATLLSVAVATTCTRGPLDEKSTPLFATPTRASIETLALILHATELAEIQRASPEAIPGMTNDGRPRVKNAQARVEVFIKFTPATTTSVARFTGTEDGVTVSALAVAT